MLLLKSVHSVYTEEQQDRTEQNKEERKMLIKERRDENE
jgi:hypothetical protein